MRVFVTGGTGFVGSAVVRELLAAGHEVLALARSEASAARLTAAGATPQAGSLEDLDAIRAGASDADAVIHAAFDNSSVASFLRNSKIERAALQAMGDALSGSRRPLVAAGGFAPVVATGPVLVETDEASAHTGPAGRNVERTIVDLADRGISASVVRMPAVHGAGDHFTMSRLIELARRQRVSGYAGQGANRLPAVYVADAARLFRLAVEHPAASLRYHAVGETGVEFRQIAQAIGRGLGVPAVGISALRARWYFKAFAGYAMSDRPASSELTQQLLGWTPTGPGLLDDLAGPDYFSAR
ncbi:SDR family oxidoreductase [Propionibacterium freudenreichii]|uniref:SDR family oxidoreductase n=1 Tax=Propionibacterium freudenreichii TaxID=1744 RepID=UPI00254F8DE3|nr:SDR family oxidoreductase [Propionibacterium freudenreichii]MDK9342367.1 SDR family oxidoreductase [Propionibacterium freudenreichii]